MNTRNVLVLCFSLLLFACPSDDNGNVDNVNILTTANYIYEGDLLKFHYENEIDILEANIVIWDAIQDNDPNYDQAQLDIQAAQDDIASFQGLVAAIPPLPPRVPGGVPVIPTPPPPPCSCHPIINTIRHIVLLPNTNEIGLSVLNSSQDPIIDTDVDTPLNGLQNATNVLYQSFNLSDPQFEGEAYLSIQTNQDSYSIPVFFSNQ